MANKIKETIGYKGRKQEWQVCSLTNLLVQNPAKFVAPATSQVVGEPFVVKVTKASGTAAATQALYTVPTGWTVYVMDACITAPTGVDSSTWVLKNNTTALHTAVSSATTNAGKPLHPVAGWDETNASLSETQVLNLVDASGATAPALTGWVMLMRIA